MPHECGSPMGRRSCSITAQEARHSPAGAASEAIRRRRRLTFETRNARLSARENRAFDATPTGAVGVEPTTARLTVECSAIELHPISGPRATPAQRPTSQATHDNSTTLRESPGIACTIARSADSHAQTEGRTRKPLRARDFESRASASSAIWAYTIRSQTSVHGWRKRRHGWANYIDGGFPRRRNPRLSVRASVESSNPMRRRCKSCIPRRSSS